MSEADGLGPALAVEVGHEQRRPEGVAGSGDVLDLYLRERPHPLDAAFVRDGDETTGAGEDDDIGAEVVEFRERRLLQRLLVHVEIEEAAGVFEGGLDYGYVGHYFGEDLPGLDLIGPDARVVVRVERDYLAEAAPESHGPPDGEALGVAGEGEGRGVDDAGAGDHLLVHLAHGEQGVGAPVDLEVGDAYVAGDEGVGGRRLACAAHGLGAHAVVLELVLDVLAEVVGAEHGDHGRAPPELGDVHRDVGRLPTEIPGELARGPQGMGHLVRDKIDHRLPDGEEVELVIELVERLQRDTISRGRLCKVGGDGQTPGRTGAVPGDHVVARVEGSGALLAPLNGVAVFTGDGLQVAFRGPLPGVAGEDAAVAGPSVALPYFRVAREGMQSGSHVLRVSRVDEDAELFVALAQGLAGTPELGDYRGEASGHGLQRGEAERLVERRECEDGALPCEVAVSSRQGTLAAYSKHGDLAPHPGPVYDLHQRVEDGAFLVPGHAVVLERILQAPGQDDEVRRLAQGRAPGERLDERQVVLLGIEPAGGDDAREADALGAKVALQRSVDEFLDGLLVLVAGRLVEDVKGDARRDGGEAGVV